MPGNIYTMTKEDLQIELIDRQLRMFRIKCMAAVVIFLIGSFLFISMESGIGSGLLIGLGMLLASSYIPVAGMERPDHADPWRFYVIGNIWRMTTGRFMFWKTTIKDEDLEQAGVDAIRCSEYLVLVRTPADAVALKLVLS